jgi:hypothetical protein
MTAAGSVHLGKTAAQPHVVDCSSCRWQCDARQVVTMQLYTQAAIVLWHHARLDCQRGLMFLQKAAACQSLTCARSPINSGSLAKHLLRLFLLHSIKASDQRTHST